MANVAGFRQYARLMPDDDDISAVLCFDQACEHAVDVGIPRDAVVSGDDAKLDLYIYARALYEYESRGFAVYSKTKALTDASLGLMNKMRIELVAKYKGVAYG